jgi:hypothetical protein
MRIGYQFDAYPIFLMRIKKETSKYEIFICLLYQFPGATNSVASA